MDKESEIERIERLKLELENARLQLENESLIRDADNRSSNGIVVAAAVVFLSIIGLVIGLWVASTAPDLLVIPVVLSALVAPAFVLMLFMAFMRRLIKGNEAVTWERADTISKLGRGLVALVAMYAISAILWIGVTPYWQTSPIDNFFHLWILINGLLGGIFWLYARRQ